VSILDLEEYQRRQQALVDEVRWYRSVIERGSYCHICGHWDDPMVMDAHHVAGRSNDPFTITVCANCHRHLSHKQRSHSKEYSLQDKPPEVVMAFMLRGISDVLWLLSRKLRDLSDKMLESWRKQ
jgi:hypothetical protein